MGCYCPFKMRLLAKAFFYSVALLLLLTAAAKITSATGPARILARRDYLLPVSARQLLLGAAALELAGAAFLLWGKPLQKKALFIVWLSACFTLYRLGLWWVAPTQGCPCLGKITDRLPFEPQTIDLVLKLMLAYFFLGGLTLFIAGRRAATSTTASQEPKRLFR
jgi:hypothetical protein